MSIKPDKWIKKMANEGMINPFIPALVQHDGEKSVLSYGLSSYGYDCRLDPREFKAFSPINATELNPKKFDTDSLIDVPLRTDEEGGIYWLLPPHTYALGITIETFKMPDNVTAIAIGKSTLARVALIVNTTPLEAGWCGRLVVELYNAASLPIRLYANEGAIQVLFFESDEQCENTYSSRTGKYQNQTELTTAKV